MPQVHINVSSPLKKGDKLEKIQNFRKRVAEEREKGIQHDFELKNIQECLQKKEIVENALKQSQLQELPALNPIEGHEITKEYRTKMMDWMVEVCTSFKCSKRTYFLAT